MTNQRQAKNPMDPVSMKNVIDTMLMYVKYRKVPTDPVILNLLK